MANFKDDALFDSCMLFGQDRDADFNCLDDPKRYFIMISNSGCSLNQVPEHYRTEDICAKAVAHSISSFQYVPEKFKTHEFCLKVLKDRGELAPVKGEHELLYNIDTDLLDRDDALFLVRKFGYENCHPLHFQESLYTEDFCLKLIEADSRYFPVILEKHISTPAFIEKAILLAPDEFYTLRQDQITYHICLFAVGSKPVNIRFVPRDMMTQELCDLAFALDISTINYIPKRFLTKKMCYILLFSNERNDIKMRFLKSCPKETFSIGIYTMMFIQSLFELIPQGIHCTLSDMDKTKLTTFLAHQFHKDMEHDQEKYQTTSMKASAILTMERDLRERMNAIKNIIHNAEEEILAIPELKAIKEPEPSEDEVVDAVLLDPDLQRQK